APSVSSRRSLFAEDPSTGFALAWSVAGALFLTRGVLVALDAVLADGPGRNLVVSFWDVIVGAGLVAKNPSFRRWGIIRLAIGLVLGLVQLADAATPWLTALVLLAWVAILSLLLGRAGKGRVALALVAFAPYAVLEAFGLVTILGR